MSKFTTIRHMIVFQEDASLAIRKPACMLPPRACGTTQTSLAADETLPQHFATRGHNQAPGSPCDMQIGAEDMPAVVAKLKEINLWIMHNSSWLQ